MSGFANLSWLRSSIAAAAGSALLAVSTSAGATLPITVSTTGPDLESLAGRLSAELVAAGYRVRLDLSGPTPACEHSAQEAAWVSLRALANEREDVAALVCFDGSFVVVEGPRAEPIRFVVSVAEALNGLATTGPRPTPSSDRPQQAPSRGAALRASTNAFSLSQLLLIDPGGFPLLWGSTLELELALGSSGGLAIEGFVPLSRAELAGQHADLRAATALLRLGPVLRLSAADFAFSTVVSVGPAFTWVSAEADTPYVGGTDSALGAIGSLGIRLAYPDRGAIFAMAGGRASLLLPAPRFAIPRENARDLGPFFIEASLGLGLRF